MPVYGFYCRRCELAFTEEMHVAEHDADVAACPRCREKKDVEKRMSSFTAVTSRKSAAP